MPDQCRAVTEDGERCSRAAEENGFCHQHGPEDETVAEEAEDDSTTESKSETESTGDETESTAADADESEDAQMDENDDTRDEGDSREDSENDRSGDASESGDTASDSESDIVKVKRTVQRDVPALIDRDLDGVTSVVREEDGWMATVEMVERHSVPDTQDILGHYEVSLNDSANIDGYRRLETYRRADGPPYEG